MTPLKILERPDGAPVVIATTVALRYAVGVGEARTIVVDGAELKQGAVEVVAHDLMPYLGTSVSL